MNCDQAFDALTNAQLRDTTELDSHLAACPRCRDLADVLEPALGLFGEVDEFELANDWQAEDRSVYDGQAVQREPNRRVQAAPWLNAQRQQQRRSARRDGAKVAMLLMLVAAITAAFANVGREEREADMLATLEPCIRSASLSESAHATVSQCVSCHVSLANHVALETRQQVRADHHVTQCVTCHLKPAQERHLNADGQLLHACLFPVKS